MKRLALTFAAAALLLAGGAHASPVQDAAQAFGLIGVWADDCTRPASGDNEYGTYRLAADGTVSLVYSSGPDAGDNRYSWSDAEILGPHFLWIEGVFAGNGLIQHTIVQMDGARMRVWSNVDSSGRVLIERGAFPDGGAPGWSQKCSG